MKKCGLKGAIYAHGFTQKSLAKRIGVSEMHITNIISGRREPSLGLLRKMAEAMEMSLAELVNELEKGA